MIKSIFRFSRCAQLIGLWVVLGVLCAALAPTAARTLASAAMAKTLSTQWCGKHAGSVLPQLLGAAADEIPSVCPFCNSLAADLPPLPAAQIAAVQPQRSAPHWIAFSALPHFSSLQEWRAGYPRAPPLA
jgi:hypothetical protein